MRVRIDKTSQLLISMSITIAEFVKAAYNRGSKKTGHVKNDEMIRSLSGFEEIIRSSVLDKSTLLTNLLNIEIFFFSKKNNESLQREQSFELISLTINRQNRKDTQTDQVEKWISNNELFGECIDKTRDYTDRRFDKRPRIKTNIENGSRYLDKAKFLTKFSCFDGYMQYVDTKWEGGDCTGIDFDEFKRTLKRQIE